MRFPKFLVALMPAAVLIAACSGQPTATKSAGGGAAGGGGATQAPGGGLATTGPAATDAGGGVGSGGGGGGQPAGWDQYGKVSYTISGSLGTTGELGFVPAASRFDGTNTTSLSFANSDQSEVLIVSITQGVTTVTWGGTTTGSLVGSTCTTSDLNIQASNGSGSFECKDGLGVSPAGAQVLDSTIKGSFMAHI